MEIPTIWRETRTRVKFDGWFKQIEDKASGRVNVYFKYPGGEIPVFNIEDFMDRLMRKGFEDDEVIEIVELFLKTVTSESAISVSEFGDGLFQQVGGKVREKDGSKV